MNEMTQIDWARLAVLIDGEGHIGTHKVSMRPRLRRYNYIEIRLTISNTDPRALVWVKNTFQCGKIIPRNKTRTNKMKVWNWTLTGPKVAILLQNCLQYFLIKRGEAELAIAIQATKSRSHSCHGTPELVLNQRTALDAKLKILKTQRMSLEEAEKTA